MTQSRHFVIDMLTSLRSERGAFGERLAAPTSLHLRSTAAPVRGPSGDRRLARRRTTAPDWSAVEGDELAALVAGLGVLHRGLTDDGGDGHAGHEHERR